MNANISMELIRTLVRAIVNVEGISYLPHAAYTCGSSEKVNVTINCVQP